MDTYKEDAYLLFFSTLTSKCRLKIINALNKGKKNVGQLQKETGLEQTCISHNLKRLKNVVL